jgi:hypothetical protein
MREMKTREIPNVRASIAKPMAPEPKALKISPAMPAPMTEPSTCETCASELAAGRPSAGTIRGRSAPRAGRKNVLTLDWTNPRT